MTVFAPISSAAAAIARGSMARGEGGAHTTTARPVDLERVENHSRIARLQHADDEDVSPEYSKSFVQCADGARCGLRTVWRRRARSTVRAHDLEASRIAIDANASRTMSSATGAAKNASAAASAHRRCHLDARHATTDTPRRTSRSACAARAAVRRPRARSIHSRSRARAPRSRAPRAVKDRSSEESISPNTRVLWA